MLRRWPNSIDNFAIIILIYSINPNVLVKSFVWSPANIQHPTHHVHVINNSRNHCLGVTNRKHNGGDNGSIASPKKNKKTPQMKKSIDLASKQDINNLIKNIGLEPVENAGKKVKKRQTKSNSHNTKLSQLSIQTQLQYARKGHTILRGSISPQNLSKIKKDLKQYTSQQELGAWQQKVEVALQLPSSKVSKIYTTKKMCRDALEEHSPDGIVEVPFLQHFNTWRAIPSVQALATSSQLTDYAKTLLDVRSVRLYQDSLFHKRQNDGPTPWHSDARMAPFDTSKMLTFWIPLDYIPHIEEGGTGLFFASGSHADFALPFWNRNDGDTGGEYDRLDVRYGDDSVENYMPMQIGDLSVHAGWTLHGANGGIGTGERYALAVTFVDASAEIREDAVDSQVGHDEDKRSYEDWVFDVEPRSYFEHDLVPIF